MWKQNITAFINQRTVDMPGTINAMMGMELVSIDEVHQEVQFLFPVQEWQLNPMGTMHGGMVATLADMAMGCLSYALNGGHPNPTIELQVRYLKGIKEQIPLLVKVTSLHTGKRMIQAKADIYQKQEFMAMATASYMINNRISENEMAKELEE